MIAILIAFTLRHSAGAVSPAGYKAQKVNRPVFKGPGRKNVKMA